MSVASKLRLAWRWFCGIHTHRWRDSGWNVYGICIEQRCSCGAYRHHVFDDLVGEYPWRVGQWHDGQAQKTKS